MNLKILFLILVYYAVLSLVFVTGSEIFTQDYNSTISLNSTEGLTEDEQDTGGLFSAGVSFSRFFGLITVGIGLPGDVPVWFKVLFMTWQTMFLILSIGFVIASIWNG